MIFFAFLHRTLVIGAFYNLNDRHFLSCPSNIGVGLTWCLQDRLMRLPTMATNLLDEASGYLSCCIWAKLSFDFFRNRSAIKAVRLKGLWFGGEPLPSTQGSKANSEAHSKCAASRCALKSVESQLSPNLLTRLWPETQDSSKSVLINSGQAIR
jgi:hypothetical protein